MTVLGRFTGVLPDELSFIEDEYRQRMGGLVPTTAVPTAALYRGNLARQDVNSDLTALATGVMTSVALFLRAGDVVTNLTFKSGATAADTPLNWWFALYGPVVGATAAPLLAQTADQATTAWAANTVMTKALATAQTITATGMYYAAIMMKATTPVTLLGASVALAGASAAWLTGEAVLAQTSGTTLTTTAPSTIASPTAVATVARVVAT